MMLGVLAFAGMSAWMGLSVYYTNLHGAAPRRWSAVAVVIASILLPVLCRSRRRGVAAFLLLFIGVVLWFFSARPKADLDWARDVAVLPTVDVNGHRIHVRNIRNFDYRSETDFTPSYYDKPFDLRRLRSVDYILSYWAGRAIAHAFVSFGFEGDEYLAISIETRKEKSESYSAVEGFFRQYELIYVVADERDLIRLRTNCRGEDVYVFRLRTPPGKMRAVLMDYVRTINTIARTPRFYNALTENCTTSVLAHFRCAPPYPPLSIDVLLSGYSARYAYATDSLDRTMPFDELEARSRITDVAKAAGNGPDFSRRIREGLPVPTPRVDLPETADWMRNTP